MGRSFVQIGLGLLALAVWAWLAGSAGWIPPESADRWGPISLKAGLACVAGGLILRTLSPVGRKLRQGHCARCGRPTDRGQAYCHDHMKQVIENVRDQVREGLIRGRPGPS